MPYTNIDDPSAYFQAVLWTGNTSAPRSITNDGNSNLQPDLVWGKNRTSAGTDHEVYDSNRGTGTSYNLKTSSTAVEGIGTTYGQLTSFDTDGFTVNAGGTNDDFWNENGSEFVAWQWKANGGTTSSNTDGSITSTVQANQDAGFSIVTYTTAGSTATIGHGLGAKPDVILLKKRNGAISWYVRHVSTGTSYLNLNLTSAAVSNPAATWTTTEPTTSVYSIGTSTDFNINGGEYVAYCFASKQGFSKFGKYVGNGNANGPFVYTGFKPAFVMIKNASASTNWYMWDNKRSPFNAIKDGLNANATNATQGAGYEMLDFLSNGFKIRSYADGTWNGSGNTIIYMAFAENPFTTSTGIPTTAR
jgi:hypothetical protein